MHQGIAGTQNKTTENRDDADAAVYTASRTRKEELMSPTNFHLLVALNKSVRVDGVCLVLRRMRRVFKTVGGEVGT
jgi:hypothetical protein